MSSEENLKNQLLNKENANKILHAEVERLKKALNENSYTTLMKRIEVLEDILEKKEKEIIDLRSVSKSSNQGNSQELKTKIIILQSKVRKNGQKMEKMLTQVEDITSQKNRIELKYNELLSKDSNFEELNNEITSYKRRIASYKAQISDMEYNANRVKELEKAVSDLKEKLTNKEHQSPNIDGKYSKLESSSDEKEIIENLKQIINESARKIDNLQNQLKAVENGGGSGFMTQNRVNRRVLELESQVNMLKKSEKDLKSRYHEAMRKISTQEEFSGW
ncbi:MAG: hypothetical protein GY870_08565 [archaeon]|nr:hypothetical protein [archaeon]